MYMRRGRKKYFDYKRYYADERLDKYFEPIVEDIKHYFFELNGEQLYELMEDYKERYGEKAYNYAMVTMEKWKSGFRKMSDQTLMRLVETLPNYLDDSTRIRLIEKLFLHFENNQRRKYDSETTTWETYHVDLQNLNNQIKQKYGDFFPKVEFNQEMLDIAKWLSKNDMILAKTVLDNLSIKRNSLMASSAMNDIKRFENLLDELKCRDEIYSAQDLQITLPGVIISMTVVAAQKSIFRTIKDIFF